MLQTLMLVRHGESEWNKARRVQGQMDSPLSAVGRAQARALGQSLSDVSFDCIYSSDLSRAFDTAALATGAAEDKIRHTPLLREMSFGPWEGCTREEIRQHFPADYQAFEKDPVANRPDYLESMDALAARADLCIEVWRSLDEPVVWVFTHGGMLKMIVMRLLNIPESRWRTLRVNNTAVTRIDYDCGKPVLRYYGVASHLRSLQSKQDLEEGDEDQT